MGIRACYGLSDLYNLAKAAEDGKLQEVSAILQKDPELVNKIYKVFDEDEMEKTEYTALHMAAKSGHKAIAELLIQNGGNVNVVDSFGRTPLYHAVKSQKSKIVRMLLEAKADVNIYNPIFMSAQLGDLTIFQDLKKFGANFDEKELLYICSVSGSIEIVRDLLASNPKLNINFDVNNDIENKKNKNEMKHKVMNEETKELEDMESHEQNFSKNPIFFAVKNDHKEVVKLLLSHGADVNLKKSLHCACKKGNLELVKMLIHNGVDINNKSPILYAVNNGHFDIVNELIKNGAKVNNGNPLFFASIKGYKMILELLIKAKANVNEKFKGNTALHILSTSKKKFCQEIIKILLQNNADVNTKNEQGLSPLMIASLSPFKRSVVVMKQLLENGAVLNVKDNDGKTAVDFSFNVYKRNILENYGKEKLEVDIEHSDNDGLDEEGDFNQSIQTVEMLKQRRQYDLKRKKTRRIEGFIKSFRKIQK